MRSSTLRQFRSLLALLCLLGCCLLAYIWLPRYVNAEIRRRIRDEIVLQPCAGRDAYERFVDSSKPEGSIHYTRFYFFNVTNLHAVRQKNAKPILEEVGPYTYRTVEEKYDIAFHWNGSLSYRERTLYYPEPDLTVGDFDDVVVTLNLALLGVMQQISDHVRSVIWDLALRQIASAIEHTQSDANQGVFMARSVKELLWGYDEPVLHSFSQFTKLDASLSLMQNGTRNDAETETTPQTMIHSGQSSLKQLGQFEAWQGKTVIDDWNGYAEPVYGTSGTFFQPFLTGEERLHVWIGDMLRAMPLQKQSETDLYGIYLQRYHIDPTFWQPDSRYFSQYTGVINVTQHSAGGSKGPPLFFSAPHFCGADPVLSERLIGLHCNESEHEFYIDVEPNTGIALRAAARFMVSTEYSNRFPKIDPYLSDTFLPVFWLEVYRQVSEDQTKPIRVDLYRALDLRDRLSYAALVCLVVFIVLTIAYTLRMIGNHFRQHQRFATSDYDTMDYRLLTFAL